MSDGGTRSSLRVLTFEERRLLKQAVSQHRLKRAQAFDAEITVGDERDCPVCGVTFTVVRGRQRYCCETHRRQANRRTDRARAARAAWSRKRYYQQKQVAA